MKRQHTFEEKRNYKNAIMITILIIIFAIIISIAEYKVNVNTYTIEYQTEEVKAVKEETIPTTNYDLTTSTVYWVGESRNTGLENEFIATGDNIYEAGVDFEPGIYSISSYKPATTDYFTYVSLSQYGGQTVFCDALASDYECETGTLDGVYFTEGDTIRVTDGDVKLTPIDDQPYLINPGTYDVITTAETGNLSTYPAMDISDESLCAKELQDGSCETTVSDVEFKKNTEVYPNYINLKLLPTESYVVTKEAKAAIPSENITETVVTYPLGKERCYKNGQETACSNLDKYDELIKQKK